MKNYTRIVGRIIADLKESPHVELARGHTAEGTGRGYITNFLKNHGFVASEPYLDFYSAVDYVDVEWAVRDDAVKRLSLGQNMGVTGRINIPSFETVINDIGSADYWFNAVWREYASANGLPEERPFIPFDFFDSDTSGCACLSTDGGRIGPDVLYFDHQIGPHTLGVALPEYVERLSETRGIYGWQRALLSDKGRHAKEVGVALARLFG